MKKQLIWSTIILCTFILMSCAAVPPGKSTDEEDKDYKKGLKYSESLHPEPIDILKKEYSSRVNLEKSGDEKSSNYKNTTSEKLTGKFAVQVASFSNKINARKYLKSISSRQSNYSFRIHSSGSVWRVICGEFIDRKNAEYLLHRIKTDGFSDAWIVTL